MKTGEVEGTGNSFLFSNITVKQMTTVVIYLIIFAVLSFLTDDSVDIS